MFLHGVTEWHGMKYDTYNPFLNLITNSHINYCINVVLFTTMYLMLSVIRCILF